MKSITDILQINLCPKNYNQLLFSVLAPLYKFNIRRLIGC